MLWKTIYSGPINHCHKPPLSFNFPLYKYSPVPLKSAVNMNVYTIVGNYVLICQQLVASDKLFSKTEDEWKHSIPFIAAHG